MENQPKNQDAELLSKLLFEVETDVPLGPNYYLGVGDPFTQKIRDLITNELSTTKSSIFFPLTSFGDVVPKTALQRIQSCAYKVRDNYKKQNISFAFTAKITQRSDEDNTPGIRIWRIEPKINKQEK